MGCISLFGAIPYARQRQIHWPSVWLFGIPGTLGTALGTVLSGWLSGAAQLSLFALVMLASATFMLRPPSGQERANRSPARPGHSFKTALQGLGVGLLTGLVGVGGGFLIVPALVLLGSLPMPYAVGTSLVIITLNSFTGFARHLYSSPQAQALHWPLIATFAAIGVLGSLAGSRLGQRLSQGKLRRGFGVFLVLMAAYVLFKNAPGLV